MDFNKQSRRDAYGHSRNDPVALNMKSLACACIQVDADGRNNLQVRSTGQIRLRIRRASRHTGNKAVKGEQRLAVDGRARTAPEQEEQEI